MQHLPCKGYPCRRSVTAVALRLTRVPGEAYLLGCSPNAGSPWPSEPILASFLQTPKHGEPEPPCNVRSLLRCLFELNQNRKSGTSASVASEHWPPLHVLQPSGGSWPSTAYCHAVAAAAAVAATPITGPAVSQPFPQQRVS